MTFRALAHRLLPCFILAIALPLAAAQKNDVISLLPAPQWIPELSSAVPLNQLTSFGDRIAIDREVGVASASKRIYRGRNAEVSVIFEKAADPSSAYALFTLYQTRSMHPVRGVDLAVAGPQYALMTRGRYFIRALLPQKAQLSEHELRSLLVSIGGARLSAENIDALPTPLPSRGLVPGSERYMLGPAGSSFAYPSIPAGLIGFEDGVEAKAAAYLVNGKPTTFYEISYPTPQIAQSHFPKLAAALHLNQGSGPQAVYGRLDSSYVLLALNAASPAAAHQLLNRDDVHEVVSTVTTQHKENVALEIVQLFVANGELIGIILVLAILGGICLYGIKRLIMKVFPRSRFVPPDDDLVIRLRLS